MLPIEKIVKHKLNTFEYSDKASDWDEFEKKLPKKKISINKYLAIGAAATILITAISIYLNKETPLHQETNTIIANTSKTNNKEQVNVENTSKEESSENQKTINTHNKTKAADILDNSNTISNTEINNKEPENIVTPIANNNTNINNAEPENEINQVDEYQPNSSFEISNTAGCLPLNINLTAKETHKDVSYKWEISDGYSTKKSSISHIFEKSGKYTIKLITEYINNKTSITEKEITVYPKPESDFSFTKDEDNYYFNGPDQDNLTWYFGDGTSSTEIDPEHNYKVIGKTKVKLVATNKFTCKSEHTETINIEPIFQIANAFSPDNNGFNDAFGPIFEYPENYDFELYIYNAQGKLYFKSSYANQIWDGKINNTNRLAEKGYYLWKLIINDKYGNRIIKNGNLNIKY